jgi:RNA polymerase sigma factor (sigma-70 family)
VHAPAPAPTPGPTSGPTPGPDPDDDLLRRVADGEPAAWREIVHRYERLVRARVRGFRLQPADADDAVAATWLRLAQHADRIQHAERLAGWLSTVAGRECLRLLDRTAHAGIPVEDVGAALPDTTPGPEQRAVAADVARELQGLVARLPHRRRQLLAALFAEDPWTYERITADIGIPTGSIGPTRARALDQLRAAVTERGLLAG